MHASRHGFEGFAFAALSYRRLEPLLTSISVDDIRLFELINFHQLTVRPSLVVSFDRQLQAFGKVNLLDTGSLSFGLGTLKKPS